MFCHTRKSLLRGFNIEQSTHTVTTHTHTHTTVAHTSMKSSRRKQRGPFLDLECSTRSDRAVIFHITSTQPNHPYYTVENPRTLLYAL